MPKNKKKNAPTPVVKESINLLNDTGIALRQLKMKQKLIQISLVIITICLIVTGSTYLYWFSINNKVINLESQLSSLENQLVTLQEVNQIANIYNNRLNKIKQIEQEEKSNVPPSEYLKQIISLSETSQANLKTVNYKSDSIKGSFQIPKLYSVEQTIQEIANRQQEELWFNSEIENFKRSAANSYEMEFTSSLITN